MIKTLRSLDKNLCFALVFFVSISLCVFIQTLSQYRRYSALNKKYKNKKKILNNYILQPKKSPTQKKIKMVQNQREKLIEQKTMILENLSFFKKSDPFFPEIKTVLQWRELLGQKRKSLGMKNLGFQQYNEKLPSLGELPSLKKDLALIEKFIVVAARNYVNDFHHIVRLTLTKKSVSQSFLSSQRRVLFVFECLSKDLLSLLYDFSILDKPMIIEGISMHSLNEKILVHIQMCFFEEANL